MMHSTPPGFSAFPLQNQTGTEGGRKMEVKRSRTVFSLALLALVLLAAGTLSAQDVKYNFMPGTDFSKYHTYKWVSIEGASHPNQIMDAEIKQAVDTQLAAKGLTKTDSEK